VRARAVLVLSGLWTLAACGGGGPAAPAGLAYSLPSPTSAVYVTGDTANMDIDAGGESMQARTAGSATLETSFSRVPAGIQVSLRVTELKGRTTTPMSSSSADQSAIDGPVVFTLDRRGAVSEVSQPNVSDDGSQFFQPLALAHSFFPRLAGRAAGVGDQWTDTISYDGPQGPGAVSSVSIVTYTVAGDTVVGGRSVVRVDLAGTAEATAQGLITGMDFSQSVKGSLTGWVLFDVANSLLVESYSDSDMRGSMDVSAAPFPLGIRVRSHGWVKLQDGN